MLTRDQRYASDALGRVQQVKAMNVEKLNDEYRALAQELPVLVHSAGLVQALTFVQSRGEPKKPLIEEVKDGVKFDGGDAHKQLLHDLAKTLKFTDAGALVKASREAHMPQYIRLTEQVIDALQWYKRLAQVELKKPKKSDGEK